MKTGILGGTFNPIHLAHLSIAGEVCDACGLDRVLFIPAAIPPHKELADETAFAHRLAMVEEALLGTPHFIATDLEARRNGKSYSVETLQALRRENPSDEFYFIIGLDSYRDLGSWRSFAKLFELTHIVVTARPGVEMESPLDLLPVAIRGDFCYDSQAKMLQHRSGNRVIFLEETYLDISSTQIRQKIVAGEPISDLVPPRVETYIRKHGLYRNPER